MRLCVVYDCLYPYTVGGGERWLRALAEAAAVAGHEVTYLTRVQWSEPPEVPGVRVVGVPAGPGLYDERGDRRVGPALLFALHVARFVRRGRYDLVHTANFPYFHLFALRVPGVPVVVDWYEVLSRPYLRSYLGPVRGRAAELVQRACVAATPEALCFSALTEARLRSLGARRVSRLPGLFPPAAGAVPSLVPPGPPHLVYAGRHVADKRVLAVPDVVAAVPGARATVLGSGPLTAALRARVERLGLGGRVAVPGKVPAAGVEAALASATCLLLPSAREGYGMVVAEAAAHGTPSVVVAGPDNAAVELVSPGVNGFVASGLGDLARAVRDVVAAGEGIRRSTAEWYAAEAPRREMAVSIARVLGRYGEGPGP